MSTTDRVPLVAGTGLLVLVDALSAIFPRAEEDMLDERELNEITDRQGELLHAECERIGLSQHEPFGSTSTCLPFGSVEAMLAWLQTIPTGIGMAGFREHVQRLTEER